MKKIKETEIYPKFEFRLSHREREWLVGELAGLKEKFNEAEHPAVTKNDLIIAALRHGFRYLHEQKKMSEAKPFPGNN